MTSTSLTFDTKRGQWKVGDLVLSQVTDSKDESVRYGVKGLTKNNVFKDREVAKTLALGAAIKALGFVPTK